MPEKKTENVDVIATFTNLSNQIQNSIIELSGRKAAIDDIINFLKTNEISCTKPVTEEKKPEEEKK